MTTKDAMISDLETKYNQIASRTTLNQMQNELTQLKESEQEKKNEIKLLKIKLEKSRQETKQREEEIVLHQRVYKVRSELLNCLQDGEVSNECKISDLHSQIAQQTNYITQINDELETKSEELQNLLTSISSKHLETKRPENIIKLLEETKAKSQEVQMAQAERIEKLEQDVLRLKDCIRASEDQKSHDCCRFNKKLSGHESESEKNRKRKYEK